MGLPKITIVTVCLNEVKVIEETISSVLSQTYQNTEYIVIDGGSIDGTRQIIEKYESGIDKFEQQKGKGIYNAMNQGIARSSGDYLHFLNAGDRFYSNETLAGIAGAIGDDGGPDIVYGDYIQVNGTEEEMVRSSGAITLERLKEGMICHQVLFSKREMFEQNGGFDESLSIVADYDWLVRNAVRKNISTSYVGQPIVRWDGGGISSITDYRIQQFLVMKRYYGLIPSLEQVFYPNVSRKLRALWGGRNG